MAYIVKAGNTLEKLYGTNWKQLSGYTGDPTKLQIGTSLPDLPNTAPPPVSPTNPAPTTNPNMGNPPPVVQPAPYVSQTSTGQDTLKSLSDAGYATDELSLKKTYRDWGLDTTYGDFTGSTTQYNAIRQKAIEETQNKLTQYQTAVKNAEAAGYGDTGAHAGEQIPQSVLNGGEVNSTYEYTAMTGADYEKVMDNIVSQVGSTDLTKIISDFSGGTLTTPELEVNKEQKDQAINDIKSAATAGLQTLQKGLAAKGMTFSGIRTDAEASLAANTLSKESGINSDFALKIINAARHEQSRRETALTTAETNYNKALEAQGYVYNPFTNTIEPTLQGKQFALDVYKAGQPNANTPTSYDEWTLAGGKEGTGMDYAKWLDRNKSTAAPAGTPTIKDFWSEIDGGKTDLQQGESWGNVWNRIKAEFPNISNSTIDNALGISWKEPGAYQKYAETKKAGQTKVKFTMPDGTVVEL